MKILLTFVFLLCAYKSLALPTGEEHEITEHVPFVRSEKIQQPLNEVVEEFRRNIERYFVQYQNFYDRVNSYMNNYRMAHVDLVTMVYNELMMIFGEDIGALRHTANNFRDIVASRVAVLGADNACITGIEAEQATISRRTGATFQACATYANVTLSSRLLNMFYPAFMGIQLSVSTVPVAVVDALGRGNVLQDEAEIVSFLSNNYQAKQMQWASAVSQLLRWETNRFETDGLFLVDEMRICLADSVLNYVIEVTQMEQRLTQCS